jgi:GT2 family glycosyltransferase
MVSVIILTRDRADLLAQCVDGVLHRTDYSNIELLIVDNESTEPATLSLFDHLKCVDRRVRTLRHPGPFNYSALNNAGARAANGEVFLLLNNDIDVIEAGWLREMVSHALRPDVGVVGAKLIYPNQTIQHGGVALGPGGVPAHLYSFAHRNDPGYFGQLALTRTLSAVTGACVAIRRSVFFEIDGLDEINFPVAFNDVDLCLRIGARGYRVVWTPFAELFHLESASRGYDVVDPTKYQRFLRDLQQMQTIWGTKLQSEDPFHNPNLVLCGAQVEIPSLPRQQRPWRRLCEEVSF